MDIQEIKEAFLEESEEYMNILRSNLETLKSNLPDNDHNMIVETYRAAHSIKGTAGFLALQNISKLAKGMEYALMPIRDKEKALDLDLIEKIQEAAVLLQDLIDNIETSEDFSIDAMLNKLS